MNESENPYESPQSTEAAGRAERLVAPPVPLPFKDRITGLIVFGVLLILGGVFCGLMVPLMLVFIVMAAAGAGMPGVTVRTIIPGAVMYGGLAVALIWMGIGSCQARRWARALILVCAWIWLVWGTMSLGVWAVIMPGMYQQMAQTGAMPPKGIVGFLAGMMAFMACFCVVLPGVFVLFYQGKDVKATCEHRDPTPRWTDRCPLPVLAVSLSMLFFIFGVVSSAANNFVFPVFGTLTSGLPGALMAVGLTALLAYVAYAAYKVRPAGWWGALAVVGFWFISYAVTFSRVSMLDYYRKMGMTEESIEMLQEQGFVQSMSSPWLVGASGAVCFVYLLFVRRYFVAAAAERAGPPDA